MNPPISVFHSEIFRGGGFYKKSTFESLIGTFGSNGFNYRQAKAQIPEFNRSTCRDFLEVGLIQSDGRAYPYFYHLHLPIPTHKLTRKEKFERKKIGTLRLWEYIKSKWTLDVDKVLFLLSERVAPTNNESLSTAFKRFTNGECLNYISAVSGNYKTVFGRRFE